MPVTQIYPRIATGVLALLHRRMQQKRVIDLNGFRVQVCPNVFNPATGRTIQFFIRHMQISRSSRVLEIGTGSGAIAAVAAKKTHSVVATDVSPYAIQCAKRTLQLNDVEDRVVLLQGDLFNPIHGVTFDCILFNPPFFKLHAKSWLGKAWGAGSNCELLLRFFTQARNFLGIDGQIQVLFSSVAPLAEILQMIRNSGFKVQIIAKGRLLRWLETLYLFRLI